MPLMFERLEHVATGPLVQEFLPEVFHGDLRFAQVPKRKAIEAVSMDDIRTWLGPHLARGPLEVTIVGDFELEAVRAAAARTLGTLPARRAVEAQRALCVEEIQPHGVGNVLRGYVLSLWL